MTKRSTLAGVMVLVVVGAACGRSGGGEAGVSPKSKPPELSTTSAATPSAATHSVISTLDSMVVLGHSGTTGYGSDPSDPKSDVPENSWATGTNPTVNSLYQRLLGTHPALKGHATSLGVDGSTVDDLLPQIDQMLVLKPLPDLVIIQSIDNDMRCDGTDAVNEKAYAAKLGTVLTTINEKDPTAQIFFVDQWASTQTYVAATRGHPEWVSTASGSGPCDTYTSAGQVRPAGIASRQKIEESYFAAITSVCAAHHSCFTDQGAMQKMPIREGDLTVDGNHLSAQGQAVMAQYAWDALPAAIKSRP